MTGIERIKQTFQNLRLRNRIGVMTHVVGGYPDLDLNRELIRRMIASGVTLIEVQLPFSDPSADGPLIVEANRRSLDIGTTTDAVLTMMEEVRKESDTPLLVMSYLNPLLAYGLDNLIDRMVAGGLDGFIVPDLPLDEEEPDLLRRCNDAGLAFVPLIAPSTSPERMKELAAASFSPLLYTVLRLGVTGRKTELDTDTISYLQQVRQETGKIVAAGFGLRSREQIDSLAPHIDCGVVGSAVLQRVKEAIAAGEPPLDSAQHLLDELLA